MSPFILHQSEVEIQLVYKCMRGPGEGYRGPDPSSKKSQSNGDFQQYWLGSLKNHKATQPAINVPASETTFEWLFADRPKMARF